MFEVTWGSEFLARVAPPRSSQGFAIALEVAEPPRIVGSSDTKQPMGRISRVQVAMVASLGGIAAE